MEKEPSKVAKFDYSCLLLLVAFTLIAATSITNWLTNLNEEKRLLELEDNMDLIHKLLKGEAMNASKENCCKAIELLDSQADFMNDEAYNYLKNFIVSCSTRLPTEAAIKRDMERTRKIRKEKNVE